MSGNTVPRIAVALAAALLTSVSFAQSEQWVEGTITENNVQDGRGELSIRKSDDGQEEIYRVTGDTELDVDIERDSGSVARGLGQRILDIEDLEEGDQVRVNTRMDADGPIIVGFSRTSSLDDDRNQRAAGSRSTTSDINTTSNRDTNSMTAQNDSYATLPGTASSLPLLAVFSALSLIAAAAVRRVRIRNK